MLKTKLRQGFTLAEVLITLGIIGVVAAMTIPTLVQNYNERVWRTGAEVFNRKLEEALKTMNTQQTLAGHTTTESFVEELSKHFKTNKICQNDELLDCFSETVYWGGGDATPEEVDMSKIKTAKNFGQKDWGTNIVGVQFANGVSALIAYNPTTGENSCTQDPYSNQITGANCLAILYDTSANKNPNTSGKDLRANGNVTKLGNACAFEINGVCYGSPFYPEPMSFNECVGENRTSNGAGGFFASAYAQSLGIQECDSRDDYWAGAVKTCGGVNNMPTINHYKAIASYLYGDKYMHGIGELDPDKAISLGFTLDISDGFDLWSGQEGNYYRSSYYTFRPSNPNTSNINYRSTSGKQAICIIN